MYLTFPAFLWALAVLAVPVIIHLFYFRRFRKVYFTNVRFLKEIKEETSSRSRLRKILVLLMRCLAIACLVFAFAQPVIPLGQKVQTGRKAVSVFVDNSFSMNSQSEESSLFNKARTKAREIISGYGENDLFQVLNHDFEGRQQRLLSREDALILLDEMEVSPAQKTLSQVLAKQRQILAMSGTQEREAYVISDFQNGFVDLQQITDSTLKLVLVPLAAVQERNVAIDSCWFESPVQTLGQSNRLLVRTTNYSDEDLEDIRLDAKYDGQVKPVGNLTLKSRKSRVDTIPLSIRKSGWQTAEISITDYPVQFDDHWYLSFLVGEKIELALIYEDQPDPFLKASFANIPYFRIAEMNARSLDYSSFPKYQLIILQDLKMASSGLVNELQAFVQKGGAVLLFPSREMDPASINNLASALGGNPYGSWESTPRVAAQLNLQEFTFRDVFEKVPQNMKMPATKGNFSLTPGGRMEQILTYRDGTLFIAKARLGSGMFFSSSAPLNESYSDLVRNAEIFIPMLYKMAISAGSSRKTAYLLGKDPVAEIPYEQKEAEKALTLKNAEEEIIPEQRFSGNSLVIGLGPEIRHAGLYEVKDRPETKVADLGLNYGRSESDMRFLNANDLEKMRGAGVEIYTQAAHANLAQVVSDQNQGIILWKGLLILALIFLALEALILRFWKT